MRVGIIGCGSIGTRHARNLRSLDHSLDLFDVDGTKSRRLADELHDSFAYNYTDIEVARDADAVLICTQATRHAQIARELLAAGYEGPLYVEKPLVTSAADAEIFAQWNHPALMVGYNWRWNQDVRAWQDSWGGRIPSHVTWQCHTDMPSWPGADYAAPALECSHELDLAYAMFGAEVTFTKMRRTCPEGIQLDGHNKYTTVLIDLLWKTSRPHRTFLARFSNGDVLRCRPSQAAIDQSYVAALQHFLACAEQHRRPDVSVMDSVRVLDTLEQFKVAHV